MSVRTIDLASMPKRLDAPEFLVWTKARWADPWTYRPDLSVDDIVWASWPTASTASLRRRYGWVVLPGASTARSFAPITGRGYWVLIHTVASSPLAWCGYAEFPIDDQSSPAGDGNGVIPTGQQTIPCFGLDRVFAQAPIASAVVEDEPGGETWRRIGNTPLPFDRDHLATERDGRMTDARPSVAPAFSGGDFAAPEPVLWTTRSIIRHVLAFHYLPPTGVMHPTAATSDEIPWRVSGLNNLPDHDSPTLDPAGMSVWDVVARLTPPATTVNVSADYAVMFEPPGPGVEEFQPPVLESAHLRFSPTLTAPITIPTLGQLPYAEQTVAIVAGGDPHTDVAHTVDSSAVVDQVVVRGPRELAVATFRIDDAQLQRSWTDEEEAQFAEPPADVEDWDQRTAEDKARYFRQHRRTAGLDHVYRDFILGSDFDGRTGPLQGDAPRPMFVDPHTGAFSDGPQRFRPSPVTCAFHPTLPVPSDFDPEQPITPQPTPALPRRPIAAYLQWGPPAGHPDAGDESAAWLMDLSVLDLRQAATPSISVGRRGGRAMIRLDFGTAAQTSLSGRSVSDADPPPEFDYRELRVTAAVATNRRPAFAIPADDQLPAVDVVRRRVYDLDDEAYALVTVAPGTIWFAGHTGGESVASEAGGILYNPLHALQAVARRIAQFHHRPMHTLAVTSSRLITGVRQGEVITATDTAGSGLDAVVSRIRVTAATAGYRMTIDAATRPLDYLSHRRRSA